MKLFWILLADFLPTKHELPLFSVEGRFMHDPSIPRLQLVKWNWPFMCRNLCCGLLVAQCSWRCQTGSRIRRTSKPHNQNGKIDQTCPINHFCLWVFRGFFFTSNHQASLFFKIWVFHPSWVTTLATRSSALCVLTSNIWTTGPGIASQFSQSPHWGGWFQQFQQL